MHISMYSTCSMTFRRLLLLHNPAARRTPRLTTNVHSPLARNATSLIPTLKSLSCLNNVDLRTVTINHFGNITNHKRWMTDGGEEFYDVDTDELVSMMESGVTLIDVRQPEELLQTGIIPGSMNISCNKCSYCDQ